MERANRRIKYRKWKKTRVLAYNPWNFDIEVGDLLVDHTGNLFRAVVSTGRNQRDAGELSVRRIKPPEEGMKAIIMYGAVSSGRDREIWWV